MARTADPKTNTLKTRVSEKMKIEFEKCLIANDETQSDVLRKFVADYIEATKKKK